MIVEVLEPICLFEVRTQVKNFPFPESSSFVYPEGQEVNVCG